VGVGGRRWARGYTSKWRVESRDEIIELYWLLSGWYTENNNIENIYELMQQFTTDSQVLHNAKYHHLSLSEKMSVKTSLE